MTATAPSDSGSRSGLPFTLLAALIFGGLGVLAVEAQRRRIRR